MNSKELYNIVGRLHPAQRVEVELADGRTLPIFDVRESWWVDSETGLNVALIRAEDEPDPTPKRLVAIALALRERIADEFLPYNASVELDAIIRTHPEWKD